MSVGGISFTIQGDAFFINLLRDRCNLFVKVNNHADVLCEIHAISEADLILPPLKAEEIDRLAVCMFPPYIGPGLLPIPIISPKKAGNCSTTAYTTQGYFDVPLLRSEKVRKRLTDCLEHTDQVALALHLLSVSIRDYQSSTADVFYDRACRDTIKRYAPEESIRRLFVSFFPQFSAVLIHASCLVRNKRAALFLAPDEGGKSTTVNMAMNSLADGIVPGDDRIVVKRQGKDFFAFGTPWGRITNPSCSARITAVFLLRKAEYFKLEKLEPSKLIEYLWQEHAYDRFFLTNTLKSVVFELIVDLSRQVTAYQMDFPKDYVDWDIINAAMEGRYE